MKYFIFFILAVFAFFDKLSARSCVCKPVFEVTYKEFKEANSNVQEKILSDFPDLSESKFKELKKVAYETGGIISERELAMFLVYAMYALYEAPKSSRDSIDWKPLLNSWRHFVHPDPQVMKGHFGTSVKILDPDNCKSEFGTGKKKFKIYQEYLKVFAPNEDPIENGCYDL